MHLESAVCIRVLAAKQPSASAASSAVFLISGWGLTAEDAEDAEQ